MRFLRQENYVTIKSVQTKKLNFNDVYTQACSKGQTDGRKLFAMCLSPYAGNKTTAVNLCVNKAEHCLTVKETLLKSTSIYMDLVTYNIFALIYDFSTYSYVNAPKTTRNENKTTSNKQTNRQT